MSALAKPRVGPWTALLLGVAAFALVYAGVQVLRIELLSRLTLHGPREIVAVRAFTIIVLIWVTLAAIVLILRLRGQRLRDIGWGMSASIWGWLLAVVFTILYCAVTIMGPALKGAPLLTDWSFFRIATAVIIGISAGICEETIFRGFVMTQAREAGMLALVQVVLSAVLFGLAHVGWGGLTGHLEIWPLIAAMLALTYLAAGRSLTPAIVAHAAIDMVIEPWLLLFMVSGGHF